MRRRHGYTLIELLVSMALILMIMSILSTAYVSGLDTFSKLKGIGDMAEKLRAATTILRRDLSADHFTGAARLSDPNFNGISGSTTRSTREGFFQVISNGAYSEGIGAGNPSWVGTQDSLHFSVKLRGNRQQDFFPGLPIPPAPNMGPTFFSQPLDATYNGYQWGEVAYYLQPIPAPGGGQVMTSPSAAGGGQRPLFALYRAQLAVVANSTGLPAGIPLMSTGPSGLNTPSSLQTRLNRGIPMPPPNNSPIGNLLLADVLNFNVQIMPTVTPAGTPNFVFTPNQSFDSGQPVSPNQPPGIRAVQIIIRVYDLKSRQTRQITLVQDL